MHSINNSNVQLLALIKAKSLNIANANRVHSFMTPKSKQLTKTKTYNFFQLFSPTKDRKEGKHQIFKNVSRKKNTAVFDCLRESLKLKFDLHLAVHKNGKLRFKKQVFILPKELIYLYLPNKSYSDIPADGVKMRLPKQSD